MNKLKKIFYIFSPIVYGTLIGLFSQRDIDFLDNLNRHITVPNFLFPIIWSILYLLMGYWAYLEDKNGDDKLVCIYWISLGINLLFTPLLFTFHLIVVALIDVLVLLILVTYIFIKDKTKKRYLLLPYIIWLVFALILMIDLTISNVL